MRPASVIRISRKRFRQSMFGIFFLVLLVAALLIQNPLDATAQATATSAPIKCSQVIPQAVKNLSASCHDLSPDQVCYGNKSLTVQFLDSATATVTPAPFQQVGDVAAISSLKSITTAPLNLKTGEWGLAVLKMKASVPGTTTGQAVTFVLYGDTTVTGLSAPDPNIPTPTPYTCSGVTNRATYLRTQPDPNAQKVVLVPANATINATGRLFQNTWITADYQGQSGWLLMGNNIKLSCDVNSLNGAGADTPALLSGSGAFYFTTGVSAQAECQDVPSAGLLIQSESPGGQKVMFRANGADITIGSTVLLTANRNDKMTMYVYEGQGWMRSDGMEQTSKSGQKMSVPLSNGPVSGLTDGLQANGAPSNPQFFSLKTTRVLDDCALAKASGLKDPCVTPPPPAPPPVRKAPTPTATATTVTTNPQPLPACQLLSFSASPNPAPLNPNTGLGCSTLSWSVQGVNKVFLNGAGVVGNGSQQVCNKRASSTTYTLQLQCPDGSQKSGSVTVTVP